MSASSSARPAIAASAGRPRGRRRRDRRHGDQQPGRDPAREPGVGVVAAVEERQRDRQREQRCGGDGRRRRAHGSGRLRSRGDGRSRARRTGIPGAGCSLRRPMPRVPGLPRGARRDAIVLAAARLRRGARAAARGGVVGHEDRPARRPRRVPGRRRVGVVADRRPRPRARRPVRGLPVPDGPVLRARRPGRAGAVAHAPAVARRGADGRRRRGRAARRRAGPARREPGAAHRRRGLPAQPVRRRVPQPHVDHAAGLRAAAVDAARRAPRAAAPAQLVVAGGRARCSWRRPAAA